MSPPKLFPSSMSCCEKWDSSLISSQFGHSREAPTSSLPSTAGRVIILRSRSGRFRVSNYLLDSNSHDFFRKVASFSRTSWSSALEDFWVPISGPYASSTYYRSASGRRRLETRSKYFGQDFGFSVKYFESACHGDNVAGHIRHVWRCPAADTDNTCMSYTSESSVGVGTDDTSTEALPPDLQPELMPRHVAIIMDGNSRWASRGGMHKSLGHAAGVDSLKQIAKTASIWGIEALTVYAFSTENWRRPQMEVDFLMHLFETQLEAEMESVMRYNFQMRFVGDTSPLPISLQKLIRSVEERTRVNTGMNFIFCVSYSGRADLVQACQQLAAQAAEGSLNPADIDDVAISNKLFMGELGPLQDPDLVIRTSGEQRISNFLLWQIAYSELVFSDILWPDFGREEFRAALVTYQRRDRRYGMRDE